MEELAIYRLEKGIVTFKIPPEADSILIALNLPLISVRTSH